ncbi:hypothetical protein HY333_00125, partial [Candidatus Collierbacteria bacterium]|nr:hypothetical protein [Candidatus Collierbacteria bacterium]
MMILAIESTCDETGASVVKKVGKGVEVLTEVRASSAEITAKYGGVVPEVVAREQVIAMIPVINETLAAARFHLGGDLRPPSQEELRNVDAIAVTYGPGLLGSLLIGVETAKALALAWNKPLIKVNHLVAHVFANWILPVGRDTETQ